MWVASIQIGNHLRLGHLKILVSEGMGYHALQIQYGGYTVSAVRQVSESSLYFSMVT
jgi:hypothetical protein